ncbi:hypothetical protein, partial [Streptomyces sp. NPDC048611]|uniref:hypothetical protein n=1 Tax=Streptomyces sp. NPDC048611 TaxID=3155635 RepID=UPI00343B4F23
EREQVMQRARAGVALELISPEAPGTTPPHASPWPTGGGAVAQKPPRVLFRVRGANHARTQTA